MAITYLSDSKTDDMPIWLEILSSTEQKLRPSSPLAVDKLAEVSDSLRAHSASFIPDEVEGINKSKQSKKAVQFELIEDPPQQETRLQLRPVAEVNRSPETGENLCLVQDVCEHFQLHQHDPPASACLGYLQDNYTQRFYQTSPEKGLTGSPKSLEEIIVWVSEDPIRLLPRSVMIRMAATLSKAVLQYHSTPWMPTLWKSKDVVFFGIDDIQVHGVLLKEPHLNVEFSLSKGKRKDRTGGQLGGASDEQSSILYSARNEVLFQLGIVLLEVGFSTPWSKLRDSLLKTVPNRAVTDYMIADKLSRLLVTSMGSQYSCIIRKCLGCDFGLGETDLASEELQEKFLMEVVVALQTLQTKFDSLASSTARLHS